MNTAIQTAVSKIDLSAIEAAISTNTTNITTEANRATARENEIAQIANDNASEISRINNVLEKALDNVKYIVPASHDSRLVVDELLNAAKEGKAYFDYETLENTFSFTDISPEQASKFTLGASAEQVVEGVKVALKTDANIVIAIGEAAFKFNSAISELCDKD